MRFSVLVALILGAALLRFLPHPQNFVPIAALALFAGAKIEDRRLALCVPILSLLIGDVITGFHELTLITYLAFGLVVWIGTRLGAGAGAAGILGGSVVGSAAFFLLTNFAVWWALGTYPPTPEGLLQCYIAGIPYFLRTLASTLCYSGLLFGTMSILESRFPALARETSV
jgi:hypothetical protein